MPSIAHVSLNADFIVISADRVSYVHDKDRVLLYKVTYNIAYDFILTYVTDTGVFWGITDYEHKLLIMNLCTNDTKNSIEGIVRAQGVAGTRNGYVYVTDKNNADVGVYSADGTFLHHLRIGRPVGEWTLAFSGAVRLSHTEDIIAFGTFNDKTPIAVYRTHP